ncbi:MAG: WG repeat-containing protein, partial [Elusimicrobiota bacterium]|nr:WG repeat-containing protein [Elusimicrobiota bacterium]
VLPPSYQSAGSFSEGCAPVKARGLWGCVDKTGKAAVPFEYEELLPFKEGAAPAKKDGRWGLLLRDGREFRGGVYEEIYPVSEGLSRVKVNGKYGFIELSGKEALPPVYSEAFPFSGGFAAARLGDKYGFISRRTLAFKERPYVSIGPYSDGLAHAQHLEGGGRCGYIDQEGKEIIPANYAMCASFDGGLAPVLKDFEAMQVPHKANGPQAAKGSWGYIDKTGKAVIDFKYDQAAGFRGGLAKVTRKGRSFYIDMSGFEYRKQDKK